GKMECQSMQVALSRKLSFSDDAGGERPQVAIQSVTCRDGVVFENHRYVDKQLMEMHQAKMWEFHLDHVTQHTQAQGPGWMQMWGRGSGKRKGLAVTESVQANRVSHEPATEWEYTRVDFAGQMTGEIARRQSTFQDRVKVLYGPVQKPL